MSDLIDRQAEIDALDEIRHALWEIDIPSPTVPEYVEHHEQVQSVWKLLDKKQKELYVLQFAQPEQLERCPIYDGVCGYPSDQCYDCPRHHGAQPEQRWIPCSERLPEEGQLVLTTIRGTDVIRVEDGETFEDAIDRSRKIVRVSVGFIGSDGWYGVDGYPEIVAPCAWMPLPDPYKDDPCNGCGYLGESCVGEGCGKLAERKEGEA